jgi:hypothetical protein
MPGGGSKSIAFNQGRHEGFKERATAEVRTGGGGVAHTFSVAGSDSRTEAAPVGTPIEEKAAGNASFAERDFVAAEKHYSHAIKQLEAGSGGADTAEMLKVCQLNRSACFLHMGDMVGAVRDCSAVLLVEPLNVKALFRRAKASSNMRTDILSVSNAKQDLHMASLIKPGDPQIEALRAQVEADLPQLEEKLLALHYRDTPFWTVGEQVMVTKKGRMKLGGRGCLQAGDTGIVRDVDKDLKAGGRVQVQNIKTGDTYWYDMEEICRAVWSEEEVEYEAPVAAAAAPPPATAGPEEAEEPEQEAERPSAVAQQHGDDMQRLEQLRSDMQARAAASAEAAAPSAAAAAAARPVAAATTSTGGPEEDADGNSVEEEEEEEEEEEGETDEDAERDIDDILAAMQEELGDLGGVGLELLGRAPEEEAEGGEGEVKVAEDTITDEALEKQS